MKNNYLNKEELALFAIRSYLNTNKIPDILKEVVSPSLHRHAACFVTVYIKGGLRGCIGTIKPVGPLYTSIIHNAVSAASQDYRFPAIRKSELKDLTAEVSVLTPVRPYRFTDKNEFLTYLSEKKPGLVLEKSGREALFLPRVWKELPDPREFLDQLCQKAGLSPADWEEGTKFWIFTLAN
jgi:uncharacterized protein